MGTCLGGPGAARDGGEPANRDRTDESRAAERRRRGDPTSRRENQVTILDKAFAVVKVTENDVTVESDKLISKQWDRSYITLNVDFAILYKDARVVIQI